MIGLFNIVGSLTSGWLGDRMPKRYILSVIYFSRALAILGFILLPVSRRHVDRVRRGHGTAVAVDRAADQRARRGDVRHALARDAGSGFAFFSHQVGGFLGVWLGGVVFERTGSYDVVWWLSILFGLLSAMINLPIVEKPVVRVSPRRRPDCRRYAPHGWRERDT